MKAFVDAHGLASPTAHRSRIMPVQLLSTAPADHVLAKVQTASFCRQADDGMPFEHKPGSPEYDDALRRLAYAIAHVLKALPPKQQGRTAVSCPRSRCLSSASVTTSYSNPSRRTSPAVSLAFIHSAMRRWRSLSSTPKSPLPSVATNPAWSGHPTAPIISPTTASSGYTSAAEIEDRIRRLHEKPPAAARPPSSDNRLDLLPLP